MNAARRKGGTRAPLPKRQASKQAGKQKFSCEEEVPCSGCAAIKPEAELASHISFRTRRTVELKGVCPKLNCHLRSGPRDKPCGSQKMRGRLLEARQKVYCDSCDFRSAQLMRPPRYQDKIHSIQEWPCLSLPFAFGEGDLQVRVCLGPGGEIPRHYVAMSNVEYEH